MIKWLRKTVEKQGIVYWLLGKPKRKRLGVLLFPRQLSEKLQPPGVRRKIPDVAEQDEAKPLRVLRDLRGESFSFKQLELSREPLFPITDNE